MNSKGKVSLNKSISVRTVASQVSTSRLTASNGTIMMTPLEFLKQEFVSASNATWPISSVNGEVETLGGLPTNFTEE